MEMKSSFVLRSEIQYWGWSDVLSTLHHCQRHSLSSSAINKLLDSIVRRVVVSCETSPSSSVSSRDSSSRFRLSSDTWSTDNTCFRTSWWFEDVALLNITLIQMLMKLMVSRNIDNKILGRFLFFYQKTRSRSTSISDEDKIHTTESVIDMLDLLDTTFLSYRSLFGLLRVASSLKIRESCRDQVEKMIGLQLDRATLDSLLIPSPPEASFLYDVDLVLRFVKFFLSKGRYAIPSIRLKKVMYLIDLYIMEVAPDLNLKPSKFVALIRAIPNSARDSFDAIYDAVNLYLQIRSGLSEGEKMKLCSELNYRKLSSETVIQISQNKNFPKKYAIEAVESQQQKLKGLLHGSSEDKVDYGSKEVVIYASKCSSDSTKVRAHLEDMQWRVMELEKICNEMQIQMRKMKRTRMMKQHNGVKYVPYFCS